MKLTKAKLKQIIKEEVKKFSLRERTIADVALEQGIRTDEEPLDEMASIGDMARQRGVLHPEERPEFVKATAFLKWLHLQRDAGFLRNSRNPLGVGVENLYVVYINRNDADNIDWPENLAAAWELEWDDKRKVYRILTDVNSETGAKTPGGQRPFDVQAADVSLA